MNEVFGNNINDDRPIFVTEETLETLLEKFYSMAESGLPRGVAVEFDAYEKNGKRPAFVRVNDRGDIAIDKWVPINIETQEILMRDYSDGTMTPTEIDAIKRYIRRNKSIMTSSYHGGTPNPLRYIMAWNKAEKKLRGKIRNPHDLLTWLKTTEEGYKPWFSPIHPNEPGRIDTKYRTSGVLNFAKTKLGGALDRVEFCRFCFERLFDDKYEFASYCLQTMDYDNAINVAGKKGCPTLDFPFAVFRERSDKGKWTVIEARWPALKTFNSPEELIKYVIEFGRKSFRKSSNNLDDTIKEYFYVRPGIKYAKAMEVIAKEGILAYRKSKGKVVVAEPSSIEDLDPELIYHKTRAPKWPLSGIGDIMPILLVLGLQPITGVYLYAQQRKANNDMLMDSHGNPISY